MNQNLIAVQAPLQEAFYSLSMAREVPDAATLDEHIRRYPQYAAELTDFAIELVLDQFRSPVASADSIDTKAHGVSPAVSRALSRFHNCLHSVQEQVEKKDAREGAVLVVNPFASLSRSEFRDFACKIGANTLFVVKMRDRQILPETITPGFTSRIAADLNVSVDLLAAHFVARPSVNRRTQFYKADGKPDETQQQSLAEAIKTSGLTEAQQQILLGL